MDEKEKSYDRINNKDILLFERNYGARHVYRNLRLTRETIRYYEKIGLVSSVDRDENGYRKYTGKDLTMLLNIDDCRHKGYTNSQIKRIFTDCTLNDLKSENHKQRQQLQKEIEKLEGLCKALKEEDEFIKKIEDHLFQFSLCDMPSFEIIRYIESVVDYQNYEQDVLPYINKNDSILSHIMREVTFDFNKGYLNSQACIIQPCTSDSIHAVHSGKAIYCIVKNEDDDDNDTIMKRMFLLEEEYIRCHNLHPKGVVYINPATRCRKHGVSSCYYECWVPVSD